ncbi:hypothetical protein BH11BAC1_BH11BAC1_09370 [soil metagenome]
MQARKNCERLRRHIFENKVEYVHNMQISANFKMKGFVGLMNIPIAIGSGFYEQCGLMEVSASNPFILIFAFISYALCAIS